MLPLMSWLTRMYMGEPTLSSSRAELIGGMVTEPDCAMVWK
jgi:hypothetical protein